MRTRSTSSSRQATALTVLVGARPVLEHGWLQHVERMVRGSDGRLRPRGKGVVVGACLVGAVVEAGRRNDRDPAAAWPALDALWLTLYDEESSGAAGSDGVDCMEALGRVLPPVVRDLRARDLARWNDAPERTLDDVLALVDRASGRLWELQRAQVERQAAEKAEKQAAAEPDAVSAPAAPPAEARGGARGWLRGLGAAAVPAGRPR
jgi:hypothetical protein